MKEQDIPMHLTLAQTFLSFSGRIGRRTYWLALIALLIVSGALDRIGAAVPMNPDGPVDYLLGGMGLWSFLSLTAKRAHDRGASGLWCLILFIPMLNVIWFFMNGLGGGQTSANAWGQTQPGPFG